MTDAVLEARRVSRRFGATAVLDELSLGLVAGEWVALVGPSGCGKTTLLQILGLLDRPSTGEVRLRGDACTGRSPAWRAAARLRSIGFVFQQHNLLGHLSSLENVALPAWRLGGDRRRALAAAELLLHRFGLDHRAAVPARVLSIGEAQRVAIARALVNAPAVILADEPTGSLDSSSSATALAALSEVPATGAALLVVTHDADIAARAARVVTMRDGRLAEDQRTRQPK